MLSEVAGWWYDIATTFCHQLPYRSTFNCAHRIQSDKRHPSTNSFHNFSVSSCAPWSYDDSTLIEILASLAETVAHNESRRPSVSMCHQRKNESSYLLIVLLNGIVFLSSDWNIILSMTVFELALVHSSSYINNMFSVGSAFLSSLPLLEGDNSIIATQRES